MWFVFEDLKLRLLSALILLSLLFLFAVIAPFLLTPSLCVLNILFLRELFKLYDFKTEPIFFDFVVMAACIFPLYFSQSYLFITFFLNICLFCMLGYSGQFIFFFVKRGIFWFSKVGTANLSLENFKKTWDYFDPPPGCDKIPTFSKKISAASSPN